MVLSKELVPPMAGRGSGLSPALGFGLGQGCADSRILGVHELREVRVQTDLVFLAPGLWVNEEHLKFGACTDTVFFSAPSAWLHWGGSRAAGPAAGARCCHLGLCHQPAHPTGTASSLQQHYLQKPYQEFPSISFLLFLWIPLSPARFG